MTELKNSGAHIANNPQLYEPARSNAFELLIPAFDALLPAGADENLTDASEYFKDVQDVIRVAVDSSSVPHHSNGVIEIKRGNKTIKFANTPTWDAGTVVLNDYVGTRVKDVLLALQNQVSPYNSDGINHASEYKHDWTLVEYTPNMKSVVRTWTLKGAWISGLSEGEFSHSNPDKKQITATVQFDWGIPEVE